MKQMIYSAVRTQPEQLAVGDYKGFDYYVLSMGTHPCAYIDVTDTDLNGKDLCVIDLECHGEITYWAVENGKQKKLFPSARLLLTGY